MFTYVIKSFHHCRNLNTVSIVGPFFDVRSGLVHLRIHVGSPKVESDLTWTKVLTTTRKNSERIHVRRKNTNDRDRSVTCT